MRHKLFFPLIASFCSYISYQYMISLYYFANQKYLEHSTVQDKNNFNQKIQIDYANSGQFTIVSLTKWNDLKYFDFEYV